jgi:hypothetical protein
VGVDVTLVKIHVPTVFADIFLPRCPGCKDQRKGGGGVRCEDHIAEEGGGEEAPEGFKVNETAAVGGGSGEGGEIVCHGTVCNVLNGGDDHLDQAERSLMIHNDRDGCGSRPDEATHFVGGAEEGAAEVVGIVEDDDLLFVVGNKQEAVGLVEACHFCIEACFKVHRASETGNVPVAGLIRHGKRVEEGIPRGVEGHGAVIISTKC